VFGRLPFGAGELAEHAEALAESRAASVPAGELARLAMIYPMLAAHLVEALGERLTATSERLAGLAFQSVPARVASTLLELAEHFGRVTPRGVRVDVRLTHGQLAELVSTTRETLTKVAGWMQAEGLARLDRRELWITDLVGMERVAAGDYQMPGRGDRTLRAV
jgi:CRP/FNR family transcriptional regulator